MSVIGGDIIEITYTHPTLGSGVIFPKAGEDSTFNPGGVRANDDANGIDGGGRAIFQLNRQRWSAEVTVAWDMSVNFDLEKLAALAGDPLDADYTIAHINGTIYAGSGRPVGDIAGNGNAATIPLKIAGGAKLQKQA